MNLVEQFAKTLSSFSSVEEARIFVGEANFRIGTLRTEITVRIYRTSLQAAPGSGHEFEFDLSHYMHTPEQAGPYMPSLPFSSSPESALNRAVSALVDYYDEAVKAGHKPKESWLISAA